MEEVSGSVPRTSAQARETIAGRAVWCAAAFVVALLLRSPHLFVSPRFWAEEATHYFQALQGASPWNVLTLVVGGNHQLLVNVVVYVATLMPSAWAPAVTTYFGLSASVLLAALVGVFSFQQQWPRWRAVLVAVVLALLPAGYEVYLSTTNVQWVCALCMLLLCVIDLSGISKGTRSAMYAVVGAFALNGVPTLLLTPAFLVRRTVAPSRDHVRIGFILGVCAAVQLAVIVSHHHPHRYLGVDPSAFGLSLILQTMFAPVIGSDPVNAIGTLLQDAWWHALWVVAGGVLLAGLAIHSARRCASGWLVATLVALWTFVTLTQLVGAIGGTPQQMLSGWYGGRYFLLGSVCFVLLLGLGQRQLASTVILGCMLVAGMFQAEYETPWRKLLMNGPSWTGQVNECKGQRPCTVTVWPGGSITLK